jgi:hypothetical protein
MEYLVFPFGKYRGVELTELPSTYIVLALEKFELPYELKAELVYILYGRLGAFSAFREIMSKNTKSSTDIRLFMLSNKYEPKKD